MGYKFYAVAKGWSPGVYDSWYGLNGAKKQIDGFSGAHHRRFRSRQDAESWIDEVNSEAKLATPAVLRVYTPEELTRISFATSIMLQPHGKSHEHISLLGTNIYEVETEDLARERALADFWTPAHDAQGTPVIESHVMHGPLDYSGDFDVLR